MTFGGGAPRMTSPSIHLFTVAWERVWGHRSLLRGSFNLLARVVRPDVEQQKETNKHVLLLNKFLTNVTAAIVERQGFRQRQYEVDLNQLTQRNMTTGTVRRIRRREEVDGLAASIWELQRQLWAETRQKEQYMYSMNAERSWRLCLENELSSLSTKADELTTVIDNHADENEKLKMQLSQQILSQLPNCSTLAREFVHRRLDPHDPKFVAMRDYFLQSMAYHRECFNSPNWCPRPVVEVTRIDEVVNPNRQRAYETARGGEILQRNPHGCTAIPGVTAFKCIVEDDCVDLNEYLLFHGCPLPRVDDIAWHGIDPQRGGEAVGSMLREPC